MTDGILGGRESFLSRRGECGTALFSFRFGCCEINETQWALNGLIETAVAFSMSTHASGHLV